MIEKPEMGTDEPSIGTDAYASSDEPVSTSTEEPELNDKLAPKPPLS